MRSIPRYIAILFLLFSSSVFISAQSQSSGPAQLAGEWTGTIRAGSNEMRLAWHVKAAPDGVLNSTIDNLDEQLIGIKTKSITLYGAKIIVTVDDNVQVNGQELNLRGTMEATLSKDGNDISGEWTQTEPAQPPFEIMWKRQASAQAQTSALPSSDIDGVWSGALNVGDMKLPLLLKVTNTADGLTAQLQSPDQSPAWIPVKFTRSGSDVNFSLAAFNLEYKASLSDDLQSMNGTFTQGGVPRPLYLKHSHDLPVVEHRRPQNPVKPYPYREEEVTFTNPGGDKLAGTLTIPEGKGRFPAVVLVQGSGPHTRDEDVMQHKPFLVLSDYLTRHGIAVLRADKRGVGKSAGKYDTATTADFADDAEAAFRYLATRPEVESKRMGLIGHSEGGTIAPIVAARNKDVAFIVMLAGTGVNGAEIVAEQQKLIALSAGEPTDKVEKSNAEERKLLDIVRTETDPAEAEKLIRKMAVAANMSQQQVDGQIKTLLSPWFRYFLTYEPVTSLRQVQCPVLVLNGSLDLQVPPAQNLPPIRTALAGNKRAEIVQMPGLNHLFQPAKTGAPSEYVQIEETMSPAVLEKVATWILQQPAASSQPAALATAK